jgi:hypothetical protein
VSPETQPLALHVPFEQTSVPVHARPQAPQFVPSEATHVPPHSRKPDEHAQVPFAQV